ncbi:MAG: hypothetical protein AB1592_19500 [Pseudomonadota bacterium]
MSEVYPSIIETPEGVFLHIARPGQAVEDIPLTVEQLAALASDAAAAIRGKVQAAKGASVVRARSWKDGLPPLPPGAPK